MRIVKRLLCLLGVCAAVFSPAHAQSVGDFYKGKNLDLYIGYSVGGGYDLYARLLARHLGKHIPGNPTVLPRNMEGRQPPAGERTGWLSKRRRRRQRHAAPSTAERQFDPLLSRPGIQVEADSNILGYGSAQQ